MLHVLERRFIYFPAALPEDLAPPELVHAVAEDVRLRTDDGVSLHGWYAKATRPAAPQPPVLLHFHGNAGNILDRVELLDRLAAVGLDILIIDYRGYGKSGGAPSEEGLYRDADAAYGALVRDRGVPAGRVVLHGQSLGAAVAIDLATRRTVAGLIVEAGFTSAPDLGRRFYGFLPGFVFDRLRNRYDALTKIAQVQAPTLVVHGTADEIVPLDMGRRLFEAAPGPKELYLVEGAGHNDAHWVGGDAYYRKIAEFALQAVAQQGGAGAGGRGGGEVET